MQLDDTDLDDAAFDDLDLGNSLESAFGSSSVRPPIEQRLVLGRRALRRRRAATGAASFVGVLAVCGTGWAVLPGAGAGDDATWASGRGTAGAVAGTSSATEVRLHDLITYDRRARLTVLPGAVVERRIHGIIDRRGVRSTAAVVTYRGETYWAAAAALAGDEWGSASGAAWSSDAPAEEASTFEGWVAEQVDLNGLPVRCVLPGSHGGGTELTIWPQSSTTTCPDLGWGAPGQGQGSEER